MYTTLRNKPRYFLARNFIIPSLIIAGCVGNAQEKVEADHAADASITPSVYAASKLLEKTQSESLSMNGRHETLLTDDVSESILLSEETISLSQVLIDSTEDSQMSDASVSDNDLFSPSNELAKSTLLFFSTDQNHIDSANIESLKTHAQYLQQYPNLTLSITGHTDYRGTELYNMILSKQRAQAVADYLFSQGVSETQVTLLSYGEAAPLNDINDITENRRVELEYSDTVVMNTIEN